MVLFSYPTLFFLEKRFLAGKVLMRPPALFMLNKRNHDMFKYFCAYFQASKYFPTIFYIAHDNLLFTIYIKKFMLKYIGIAFAKFLVSLLIRFEFERKLDKW